MSSSREILTFQFGNYANHIGAHWWNIQESGFSYDDQDETNKINHDVLYREGHWQDFYLNGGLFKYSFTTTLSIGSRVSISLKVFVRQTTFTPRLLLVELDGALKHLPREGELYGNSVKRATNTANESSDPVKKLKDDLQWNDDTDVEVVAEPEVEKNDFQKALDDPTVNLDEQEYDLVNSVETWVDFLYARYHPRTVNVIKEYKYAPDKQTFDTFSNGVQLWKTEQFQDEFCDKIRQYVEECDFLQGFQTIFDCFNGYSGLATKCLEHLNDEYTKANFAVPVFAPKSVLFENTDEPMTDSIRVVNSALTFNQLIEQSSLFVPLCTKDRVWRQLGAPRELRSLNYQADNLYQTSSILAAYLDTISMRYRLKDAPAANSLGGFCGDLTNYGRKLAAGALALPFAMQHNEDLIDCLDKYEGSLFTQLTPNCSIGSDYIIQSLCVRGIPSNRLKRPLEQAKLQMRMAAYKCNSVSEMLQLYLQCSNHASMSHVSSVASAMPTRIPFPCEMFDDVVNVDGFLTSFEKRAPSKKVCSVPTLASVQSSSKLADTVEALHREAKRVKIAKLHRFAGAGLEEDDYVDALENLLLFKDNYEDNFEL